MAPLADDTTTPNAHAERICTSCDIHHVDNCSGCFGFGVYESTELRAPVSAHDAHARTLRHAVVRCDVCGCDERGIASRT